MNRYLSRFVGAALVVSLVTGSSRALGDPGYLLTYQGRLMNGGSPVNGSVDLQFAVWDAATGGGQVSSTWFQGGVAVTQGLFTVPLNLGIAPWVANDPRWLEVTVNGQVLSPRQTLSPVPFSLNTRGLYVDSTSQVGIGTTTPKKSLHNEGDYYGKGHLWLHAFEGDGNTGTAYVQARDDSGTSSIGLRLRSQNAGAIVEAMSLLPSGNVGIGTNAPTTKLEVAGTVKATAMQMTTGAGAGKVLTSDASGVATWQSAAGGPWTTQGTDISYTGGEVGIGTTSPGAALDVRGDIKLGTAGDRYAVRSEGKLGIVRGVVTVSHTGVTTIGAGYTLVHDSDGHFTLTFTTPFTNQPTVTCSTYGSSTGGIAEVLTSSVSSAVILTFDIDQTFGALIGDRSFSFIAIGGA